MMTDDTGRPVLAAISARTRSVSGEEKPQTSAQTISQPPPAGAAHASASARSGCPTESEIRGS
jgi:hypothetical protein